MCVICRPLQVLIGGIRQRSREPHPLHNDGDLCVLPTHQQGLSIERAHILVDVVYKLLHQLSTLSIINSEVAIFKHGLEGALYKPLQCV